MSVNALIEAAAAVLGALPGVARAAHYAGELEDSARATLRVPALLLAPERLETLADPGTGELHLRLHWSVFCCTRQASGSDPRGVSSWDLAEAVLLRARLNRWGVPGVSGAEAVEVRPLWELERQGLAVRQVRLTQNLRLGVSEWDGVGVEPSEIWLGIAPKIGAAHVDDYWRVDEVPTP